MDREEFWEEFGRLSQGLHPHDIAKELQVSRPTVYRYRDRVTAPHKFGRTRVLDGLMAMRKARGL